MHDFHDVCNFIIKTEEKHDLFEKQTNSIYYWVLLRFALFTTLCDKLELTNYSYKKSKYNYSKYKKIFKTIVNNIFISRKQCDVIILRNINKVIRDNEVIDKFTSYLKNDNEICDKRVMYMEHTADYCGWFENRVLILPTLFIKLKIMLFKNKSLIDDDCKKLLNVIENEFEDEFGVSVDIVKIAANKLELFETSFKYFDKVFKTFKAKQLYLSVAYSNHAMVAAAKHNKVEVVEMQHGVIDEIHPGYSFPKGANVRYFPDKIFAFSKEWFENIYVPISDENIIEYGYPYAVQQMNLYNEYEREEKSILFISQRIISNKLADIAYVFLKEHSDYKIYFKLHPEEYSTWKEYTPLLLSMNTIENFEVIDGAVPPIYELFAKCDYMICGGSTAVYEGMDMGIKTILFDDPRTKRLYGLKDKYNIDLISDARGLYQAITNYKSTYKKTSFFKNAH